MLFLATRLPPPNHVSHTIHQALTRENPRKTAKIATQPGKSGTSNNSSREASKPKDDPAQPP